MIKTQKKKDKKQAVNIELDRETLEILDEIAKIENRYRKNQIEHILQIWAQRQKVRMIGE